MGAHKGYCSLNVGPKFLKMKQNFGTIVMKISATLVFNLLRESFTSSRLLDAVITETQ